MAASNSTQASHSDSSLSAYGTARSTIEGKPLSPDELRKIDAYWRASLYLCMGMLYLKANPLLREPLSLEHTKPRLLGHWGSDPGQCFTYIHFNRLIKKYDLNAIYISGPGHGAPAVLSQAYLEGTYSEIYPDKSEDLAGMQRFFKQFSFPGGIGSHATPETPGSIHEGGELGYSLSHAYGTVYDNPDLIALVMVGDGEAETGPLGDQLAQQQIPQPDHRRGGAAGPASQRLQDQQSDDPGAHQPRRVDGTVHRLRLHPVFRRGQRSAQHAPGDGGDPGALRPGDPQGPGRGAPHRPSLPAALARGHPAQPQGLDGPARGGRALSRRFLAGAPDPASGHCHQPWPIAAAGKVDAQLQARRTFRRRRDACCPS